MFIHLERCLDIKDSNAVSGVETVVNFVAHGMVLCSYCVRPSKSVFCPHLLTIFESRSEVRLSLTERFLLT